VRQADLVAFRQTLGKRRSEERIAVVAQSPQRPIAARTPRSKPVPDATRPRSPTASRDASRPPSPKRLQAANRPPGAEPMEDLGRPRGTRRLQETGQSVRSKHLAGEGRDPIARDMDARAIRPKPRPGERRGPVAEDMEARATSSARSVRPEARTSLKSTTKRPPRVAATLAAQRRNSDPNASQLGPGLRRGGAGTQRSVSTVSPEKEGAAAASRPAKPQRKAGWAKPKPKAGPRKPRKS
jgi:hypothetical protein